MSLDTFFVIAFVFNFIGLYLIFKVFNMSMRQSHSLLSIYQNILAIHQNFVEITRVVESLVDQIEAMMVMSSPQQRSIYKTQDGKLVAGSLEELIEKIRDSEEGIDLEVLIGWISKKC